LSDSGAQLVAVLCNKFGQDATLAQNRQQIATAVALLYNVLSQEATLDCVAMQGTYSLVLSPPAAA